MFPKLGGKQVVYFFTRAFNAEKTLHRCMRSILNQTYFDFHYYICDNGSSDSTWKIMQDFASKDSRVHLFRNEQNTAHDWSNVEFVKYLVENNGDKHYYYCALDSDDEYKPTFLKDMLTFVEANALDISICGSDFIFEKTGKLIHTRAVKHNSIIKDNDFSQYFPVYHQFIRTYCGKLYSSSVLHHLEQKNIPSVAYGGDTLFTQELFRTAERVGILSDSLHKYYMSSKSASYHWDANRVKSDRILDEFTRNFLISKCGTITPDNDVFLLVVYFNAIKDTLSSLLNARISLNDKLTEMRDMLTNKQTHRSIAYNGFTNEKKKFFSEITHWILHQPDALSTNNIEITIDIFESLNRPDYELFSFFIDIKKRSFQTFQSLELAFKIVALTSKYPLLANISVDLATTFPQVVLSIMKGDNIEALDQFITLSEDVEISEKDVEAYILLGQNLAAATEHIDTFIHFKKIWISYLLDNDRNREAEQELSEYEQLLPEDEDFAYFRSVIKKLGEIK